MGFRWIMYMDHPTFIAKYKPYYVKDFYTDEKFRVVLRTLLDIDNLNVLFVGKSGCGKSTLLYAIIREYYGLSENSPFPENNILHINNLKEQGINYYRTEMKTFCRSSTNIFGKKKLIIVDDLDMLNEQSQQVFRNYIDKYQNNVNFISVCTSIQKVIESIQSRLHILKMESPHDDYFKDTMCKIITKENLQIDEESRQYLLNISSLSIRSLIKYLEKIYIYGEPVDLAKCKKLCSHISFDEFKTYIAHIRENQIADAIKLLFNICDYGYSVIDILDYFFIFVKSTDIFTEDEKYAIIPLLCKYITIFNNVHEDAIELAFFTNNLCKVLSMPENK